MTWQKMQRWHALTTIWWCILLLNLDSHTQPGIVLSSSLFWIANRYQGDCIYLFILYRTLRIYQTKLNYPPPVVYSIWSYSQRGWKYYPWNILLEDINVRLCFGSMVSTFSVFNISCLVGCFWCILLFSLHFLISGL